MFFLLYSLGEIYAQCNDIPVLEYTAGASLCAGEVVTFTLTPNLPTGCQIDFTSGESYELKLPNGNVVPYDENTFSTIVLETFSNTGIGTYEARYRYSSITIGSCPCGDQGVSEYSNEIVVYELPDTPVAEHPDDICPGEITTLTASAGIGENLVWKLNDEIVFIGETFQTPPIYADTIYTVYATNEGCESEIGDVVNIVVAPLDVPIVANDTICLGASAILEATNPLEGEEIYWYDVGDVNILNVGSVFQTPPLAYTTNYRVRKRRGNCFSDFSTVLVLVEELDGPIVPETQVEVCFGESTTLSASSIGNLHWYADGILLGVGNNISYTPSELGAAVSVIDVLGDCESEPAFVNVVVNLPPEAPKFSGMSPLCAGETITLSYFDSNPEDDVVWETPKPGVVFYDPETEIPYADETYEGIYTLIFTDENGCVATTEIYIEVIPSPIIGLQASHETVEGRSVALGASGGISYSWEILNENISISSVLNNPASASPIFTPPYLHIPYDTTYTLVVTVDDGGCVNTATTEITVRPPDDIIVYDVITPNGDGKNDEWYITFPDSENEYEIYIYDRHNQVVFSYTGKGSDYLPWDGTIPEGDKIPFGPLLYTISAIDSPKTALKTGMLTIINKR